jgi:hypothetical protein
MFGGDADPTLDGSVRPERLRVRQNDPSSTSGQWTTSLQRLLARVPARALSGALIVLMLLTSLAVASVSVWLVFPYVALMAVILFAPLGRREWKVVSREESEAGSDRGAEFADERAGTEVEDLAVGRALATAEFDAESSEMDALESDPREVKTKRGKGRARRPKAAAASPGATATWIRIGPGKFVRVETPGPPIAAVSPSFESDHGDQSDEMVEVSAVPASAPDDSAAVESVPVHTEGHLTCAPSPDLTVGSKVAEVIDVALDSPRDGLSVDVDDPVDSVSALSEIGAGSTGTDSPDAEVETDAVPTAEESSLSRDEDRSEVVGREAPSEPTMEWARDSGDQPLKAVAEALVAEEVCSAASEVDASSENGPSTDAVRVAASAGDNGIAPDAFVEASPTLTLSGIVLGEASLQDRGADADGPTASYQRRNRPTVGRRAVSWRGLRPRVGSTSGSRSTSRFSPGAASPRCLVRPGRTRRVLPGLRLRSRREAVPSRQFCRSFRPRSPPIPAERFPAIEERGDGQGWSLRQTPGGNLDHPRARSFFKSLRLRIEPSGLNERLQERLSGGLTSAER